MMTYQYQSLDESKSEIRLFVIQPAPSNDDVIEVKISVHSLDNTPQYFALSYVCGDQNQREIVQTHDQHLSITKNLHSALHYLRRYIAKSKTLLFWADAICIAQDSKDEKSQQVLLMGRVFGAAQQVIAWLGPRSDESDLTMGFLNKWSSVSIPGNILDRDTLQQFVTSYPDAFDEAAWTAVDHFFRHQWWRRVWTYQEGVLAKSLVFMYGLSSLRLDQLMSVVRAWDALKDLRSVNVVSVDQYMKSILPPTDDAKVLNFHRLVYWNKEKYRTFSHGYQFFSMHGLQEQIHTREATDDRDKLYAMLGVADSLGFEVKPDYDNPTSEVYFGFAAKHIVHTRTLELLSSSGIGLVSKASAALEPNLPSWVPDLRDSTLWPRSLRRSRMDWHEHLLVQPNLRIDLQDRTLFADGVECDVVSTVLSASDDTKHDWDIFIIQQNILHPCPYPTGTSKLQAWFRTLRIDRSDSRRNTVFENEEERKKFWSAAIGFLWLLFYLANKDPSIEAALSELIISESTDLDPYGSEHSHHVLSYPPSPEVQLQPRFKQAIINGYPIMNQLYASFLGVGVGMDNADDHENESCSDNNCCCYYCPQTILNLPLESITQLGYNFVYERGRNVRDRILFTTAQGYMGLGPEGMQAGDRLCFLFGGLTPLLLRPVKDRDGDSNCFALVGACYVYGLMEGEIIDFVRDGRYVVRTFMIR